MFDKKDKYNITIRRFFIGRVGSICIFIIIFILNTIIAIGAVVLGLTVGLSEGMFSLVILLTPIYGLVIAIKRTPVTINKLKKSIQESLQHQEFGEMMRFQTDGKLPSYEIRNTLPIRDSNDLIVIIKHTTSFRNVFRCHPDGSIIWQAELPRTSDKIYTNIEWKNHQLIATTQAGISVIIDMETGKTISPKL